MTDRLPWFRCFPSKLLGALGAMQPDEGYVYVTVILRIYEVGGPIGDDASTLSRRTGMPVKRVMPALETLISSGKLRLRGGKLWSDTCKDEIEHRKSVVKAKKSNRAARSEKTQQNQRKRPNDRSTTVARPNNGTPIYKEREEDTDSEVEDCSLRSQRARAEPSPMLAMFGTEPPPPGEPQQTSDEAGPPPWPSDAFEQFWKPYPHKVGKRDAEKAFAVLKRDGKRPLFAALLASLDHYIATKPPDRAWCNPATWIRQGRWDDEPATDAKKPNGHHAGGARENAFLAGLAGAEEPAARRGQMAGRADEEIPSGRINIDAD